MTIFASAFDENADVFQVWCGSSAWLECRPVTPEVEGSSPFRTAKQGPTKRLDLVLLYGGSRTLDLVPRGDSHRQVAGGNVKAVRGAAAGSSPFRALLFIEGWSPQTPPLAFGSKYIYHKLPKGKIIPQILPHWPLKVLMREGLRPFHYLLDATDHPKIIIGNPATIQQLLNCQDEYRE